MPLNQSRHAPLTSVATSAVESRHDLSSPYTPYTGDSSAPLTNGWPNTPGGVQSQGIPYSPGMRTNLALQKSTSNQNDPFDNVTTGEIQMQSFQEGLPPPPPVTHSWKRIDRWVENNYEELYDQLSGGCTQNDINELEHELDCSLPMEVRESLQVHDGQERGGRPTGIIFGCMLLDCEEIVQEWKNWRTVNEEFLTAPSHHHLQNPIKAFGGASLSSNVSSQQATNPFWRQELLDKQDSQPSRAIQKVYAHPGWIPLARDWGGNNIAVDLAPGPVGKWGQIIIFGRDYDCKYVIARSWSAFLAMVADDIGSEKVFVDEENSELKLREFRAAGVEPAYLDILRWRMDQKYGRKGPKRRPTSGIGVHTNLSNVNSGSNSSSPYGSPTEERGRSPQRFPNRGPHQSSPRGNMVKPSPLAKVNEERTTANTMYAGGDAANEILAEKPTMSEKNEDLMQIASPAEDEGVKTRDFGALSQSDAIPATEGRHGTSRVMGLGVDGLEKMNDIAI